MSEFLADPGFLGPVLTVAGIYAIFAIGLQIQVGHGDAVRQCAFTNYCEGLDQMHKQVTCKLWDREALDEAGVPKSDDGKRRLIAPARQPCE